MLDNSKLKASGSSLLLHPEISLGYPRVSSAHNPRVNTAPTDDACN